MTTKHRTKIHIPLEAWAFLMQLCDTGQPNPDLPLQELASREERRRFKYLIERNLFTHNSAGTQL